MLHPELQGLKALLPFRRNPAEVAKPVVDEDDACAEVHLVEREAGEVGARRQASLARAKRLFAALALGDVDGEAHQALGLAGDVEMGPPAGGDPAHAAVSPVGDPVLHVDGSPSRRERSMASRTRSQSSGWTEASNCSRSMTSSGEYPKIVRARSVAQKTPVP